MDEQLSDSLLQSTRRAYIWTRVLDTPFWAIFNILPFILYKALHATPFQLAVMTTLKPLVSILAPYWSARTHQDPHRLAANILSGRVIAYLPFLAFPFVQSAWYVIACFGLFMFLQHGMMPAWMELLRQNLPQATRERVFSNTQAFGYLGGGLLPLAFGLVLDDWEGAWAWMFPIGALTALCSLYWQSRIKVRSSEKLSIFFAQSHPLFRPWKSALNLLKRRPDFAKFQIGFMLIGSALMIIQPALPIFFTDGLRLSYFDLGAAITLCKGISFACGSPFWARWIQRVDLFHFGSAVALLAALFPLLLISSQYQIIWLYLAYLIYGFMQAGNELSWNLSGPIFAGKEDSSPYSSVNIFAVGMRGLFVPFLGALCLVHFGSQSVMVLSAALCLLAALRMALYSKKEAGISSQIF